MRPAAATADSVVTLALAATLGVFQRPAVSMEVRLLREAAAFTLAQDRVLLLPGIATFTFAARESPPIEIGATVAEAMAILFMGTTIPIGGGIRLLMMETR